MSMRRFMVGAAGGLAIALGAGPISTLQAQGASSADQQFITRLAAANLLEIRLGQATQAKASTPSVKQFAQRMVADHTTMQQQWMALASRYRLAFKADLNPRQVEQFERLNKASGVELERAYMAVMVQNHRDNVSDFQNHRRVVTSSEIRALLDRGLAAQEEHHRLAQQISSQPLAGATPTPGTQPDTTSTVSTQPGQPAQTIRADSAFISEVDAGNVAELRLARMAESRAADPMVKSFAQRMATDHSSMRNEWAAVSSRNGLRFSANINPQHQEQITRLERLLGREFDRAYMAVMVQNHQANVTSFQTRGRAAQSTDVRQLVERRLPSLQQHLSLAQQTAGRVSAGPLATGADTTYDAPGAPDTPNERGRQGNVRADAQFIRDVDASHFLQVRLGRLAQEKSREDVVKRFGERMEKDHADLQKQWSDVASRNGKKFKSGMGPEHRANLERLEKMSGRAFDRAYMTFMIQSHNGYLNYWRKEGRAARSAPVRQVVNRGLPTLEEHMDMAQRIGKRIGVDSKAALAGRRIAADRSDNTTVIE